MSEHVATCKDCLHYDPCFEYGNVLDPLHGGVKCDSFKPAADVVEVVRCKDCKYHHWEQEPCHGKTEHFCSVLNAQVFKDFYCYHGEKMDGNGDT